MKVSFGIYFFNYLCRLFVSADIREPDVKSIPADGVFYDEPRPASDGADVADNDVAELRMDVVPVEQEEAVRLLRELQGLVLAEDVAVFCFAVLAAKRKGQGCCGRLCPAERVGILAGFQNLSQPKCAISDA